MTKNNTMTTIQINEFGSPEVLKSVETETPSPQPGEILIKNLAIGVNYSDILRRKNTYFMPTPLPYVLGAEAVGEVVSLGEGVDAPPFHLEAAYWLSCLLVAVMQNISLQMPNIVFPYLLILTQK